MKGAAEQTLGDIPDTTRELLLELSPYRYLSYRVLQDILENGIVEWTGSHIELADYLTATHLASWDKSGCLLRDDISRRLVALHLRYSQDGPSFTTQCVRAREIYERRLADRQERDFSPRWAVEYLYQSLQMQTLEIHTPQEREVLRLSFWGASDEQAPPQNSDLYRCLDILVSKRNAKEQLSILRRVLQRDWEFKFTLNYFLREETYEEKWFELLLDRIQAFLIDYEQRAHSSTKGEN